LIPVTVKDEDIPDVATEITDFCERRSKISGAMKQRANQLFSLNGYENGYSDEKEGQPI
jgi:hypothetical protein